MKKILFAFLISMSFAFVASATTTRPTNEIKISVVAQPSVSVVAETTVISNDLFSVEVVVSTKSTDEVECITCSLPICSGGNCVGYMQATVCGSDPNALAQSFGC